ncbi:MAG: hypothetical protein JST58_04130 [Bacteroidetes bacterium]|nr:hypothetical protein [Bacteroidota bacterium]
MVEGTRKWLKIALLNLMLVAFLGTILRYKIVFSIPFIDQRNLLHSHSHFAFAGWVSHALMTLLIAYLCEKSDKDYFGKYRWLLIANLLSAYGMLVSFIFQGYAFVSILFSTLSIFVSYWFAIVYWKDLNQLKEHGIPHLFFKAALVFNALSSIGPFFLAYMMASKNMHQNEYLASVYFFLHFQYNGWFFFSCMGLFSFLLTKYGMAGQKLKMVFYLFAMACLPAYLLSALWLPMPYWVYLLVVAAAMAQLLGWGLLVGLLYSNMNIFKKHFSKLSQWFFALCAVAFTIKLSLQACSVIPALSKLAFGFRPIIIAYLHLVLLAVISLFILAYMVGFRMILVDRTTKIGLIIFVTGIFLNEFLLMIQGIGDLFYFAVPSIELFLLIAAMVLFTGMAIVNYRQAKLKNSLA